MSGHHRVGTDILVNCPRCEAPVIARVQAEMVSLPDGEPPALYELSECSKCDAPLLTLEEDWGDGWDGEPGVIWPRQHRPLSIKIPGQLQRAHEEARKCFSAKAYTAAAVMVRRTLEGVCQDQNVQQGNRPAPLFRMLEALKRDEKIDGRLFEWAQALRILGNQGAHFTDAAVTREDAADGLALTEALLDYLYVLSAQFDEFKARRAPGQEPERT